MKPTALVVTTVHWPDDTRIRERLIRTLNEAFTVKYAAKTPGPIDRENLVFIELGGGRLIRDLRALAVAMREKWDVMVVHDLELVPMAIISRMIRRRPVVFDVHEDFPATAFTRSWVPHFLRRPISALAGWLLRLAERSVAISLAEPGYARLFRRSHPVFMNYPDTRGYPEIGGACDGPAVYVGDVTAERGVEEAVEACESASVPLRLIGPVKPGLRATLERSASAGGLIIEGRLPNRAAIAALSSASVGLAPLRDLPNYRHSQPTKVLEYLAMGIPVVASDLPGTRALVEGLDAVELVRPGDATGLAGAITRSRVPQVHERARAQARRIRTDFTWPADRVVDFYESLL